MRLTQRAPIVLDPLDAAALVSALAWLRPFAALGQAFAVFAAIAWLRVSLPLAPILAGVVLMLLAGLAALWRLSRGWPVAEWEAVGHVALDLLLLGWTLYFTGGASNPFITLLLVPVALAATTLSLRGVVTVVVFALVTYGILMVHYVALPDISARSGAGFRLHLTGMAINFLIAVLMLAVFVGRVTTLLRRQRKATRALRERALRNEGILAVATQAATAAHELNTPLSTLLAMLPDLARAHAGEASLHADLQLATLEVERCRDALHRMVEYGQRQLSDDAESVPFGQYVRANADRFRLLCPAAILRTSVPASVRECRIEVQPSLAHALLSLLQNAYDASVCRGSRVVTLDAAVDHGVAEFVIADRGAGFGAESEQSLPGSSTKRDGLGIGLALACATVERLRGELRTQSGAHGTCVRVRVPVAGADQS